MTTQSPNSNQLDLEFLFMLDSLHDWYEDTKRIDHPELHIFLRRSLLILTLPHILDTNS